MQRWKDALLIILLEIIERKIQSFNLAATLQNYFFFRKVFKNKATFRLISIYLEMEILKLSDKIPIFFHSQDNWHPLSLVEAALRSNSDWLQWFIMSSGSGSGLRCGVQRGQCPVLPTVGAGVWGCERCHAPSSSLPTGPVWPPPPPLLTLGAGAGAREPAPLATLPTPLDTDQRSCSAQGSTIQWPSRVKQEFKVPLI